MKNAVIGVLVSVMCAGVSNAGSYLINDGKYFVLPENGPREGTFIFDTRYVSDTGSYLTNDTVHIALVKTVAIIPDTTEVWCYHRGIDQTNAEDWVQFTPVLTIADFPYDYFLENAISNDVSVTANYVAPSPEITNLLFTTSAKLSYGALSVSRLPLVVPGSHAEAVDTSTGDVTKLGNLYNEVKKEEEE